MKYIEATMLSAPTTATVDRRYDGIDVPQTESLADCQKRMLPLLHDEILPSMRAAVARVQAERDAAAAAAEAAAFLEREPVAEARDGASESGSYTPTYVVSSSENLLRSMVMALEGLSEDEVPLVDVPYATPLVYEFDAEMRPIPTEWAQSPLRCGWYMADPERVCEVQQSIRQEILENEVEEGAEGQRGGADELEQEEGCLGEDERGSEAWLC